MVVYRRIPRFPLNLPAPVAAIGIFDGVHSGHRAILKKADIAVTFYPHPLSILHPAIAPPLLMSLDHRLAAISRLGIRRTVVIPFSRSFSRWSPERFAAELLAGRLRARAVVVGYNFRFGRQRAGTVRTLRGLGKRHGFKVHVVSPVRSGGVRVSSGRLRDWLRQGKIGKVRRLMGGPATVTGRVMHGAGRGVKLGFPTANLKVESGLLPPVGVYAVRARINKSTGYKVPGTLYGGMANWGFRPTFPARQSSPILEVHLFGPRHSLYGRRMEVEFLRRLRGEKRFPSAAALARQLSIDARRARWYTPPR